MSQEDNFDSSGGKRNNGDEADFRTLTRADLADAVHKQTGLGRAESSKFVEMVLEEIFETIVAREDVKLSSFGAFLVRAKKERQGRNPKTGAGAKITARLVVTFKPSNVLRTRINQHLPDGETDAPPDGHDKSGVPPKGAGQRPPKPRAKPDGKGG